MFVRRSTLHAILRKRYLLKGELNTRGQNFDVQENLTLVRRQLKSRVEKELTSYRYNWVRNGNIFVRKHRDSNPIKIHDESKLDELLSKQSLEQHELPTTTNVINKDHVAPSQRRHLQNADTRPTERRPQQKPTEMATSHSEPPSQQPQSRAPLFLSHRPPRYVQPYHWPRLQPERNTLLSPASFSSVHNRRRMNGGANTK